MKYDKFKRSGPKTSRQLSDEQRRFHRGCMVYCPELHAGDKSFSLAFPGRRVARFARYPGKFHPYDAIESTRRPPH